MSGDEGADIARLLAIAAAMSRLGAAGGEAAAAAWLEAGRLERERGHTLAAIRHLRRALAHPSPPLEGLRELARLLVPLAVAHPARPTAPPPPETSPPEASPPEASPKTSVILCSPDSVRSAEAVARWRASPAGRKAQVIPIIDPPSLAAGYNQGLSQANGEIVIFSHDDVTLPQTGALQRIAGHLRHVDVLGLAGTTRLTGPGWISAGWPFARGQVVHVLPDGALPDGRGYSVSVYHPFHGLMDGVQALDGLLIAARRPVAEAIGFDAATFPGFHLYDLDFSFRAHLAGFRLGVAGDIDVLHASPGNYDASWAEAAAAFAGKFAGRLGAAPPNPDTFLRADFATAAQAMRFCRALARLTPRPGAVLPDSRGCESGSGNPGR